MEGGRAGGEEGGREYSIGESIEIPLSLTLGILVREYLYEEEAACTSSVQQNFVARI